MPQNPLFSNALIDSCAFDPKYEPETSAANELHSLAEVGTIQIVIAHSTRKETEHPNTPAWVYKQAGRLIYSVAVSLTPGERTLLKNLEVLLAGKGKLENMKQDARHVFEAHKYGPYFITVDKRLLDKAQDVWSLCRVCIVKPSTYLRLVQAALKEREGFGA